jgi:FkbM family methyltransferase
VVGILKAVTPAPLWPYVRSAGYSAIAAIPPPIRFHRSYVGGWLFDLSGNTYRSDGLVFTIPRELTTRTVRGRFYADTHERAQRRLIERHLPVDGKVLELGACLGIVSCFINTRLQDKRSHVAVEANPKLIDVIETNKQNNNCGFAVEHCKLSRSQDASFYLNNNPLLGSTEQKTKKVVKVPVRTVEEVEAAHSVRFDSVFMDIQGGELDFLRENQELLSRCRCMILELHASIIGDEGCAACRSLLTEAGLTFVEKRDVSEAWLRTT